LKTILAQKGLFQRGFHQPGTLDTYLHYYNRYIKDDPFLLLDMNTVDMPAQGKINEINKEDRTECRSEGRNTTGTNKIIQFQGIIKNSPYIQRIYGPGR